MLGAVEGEVLITGATGFVGRRLAAELKGRGVRGLSRDPARAKSSVSALASAHAWTAPDAPVPDAAVAGARAVVHLAGEPVSGRWTRAKKRAIEDSRRDGTRSVVDAIARVEPRPEVLVSASAIGYYGSRGDEELTETSRPGDDFLARVCKSWEDEALRAEDLGVRVVRLRIGLVMGEGGGALEAMLPLFKLGLGGKLGDGRQWWPWVHIDDILGLAVRAIDDPEWHGAFNATAPTPVRQAEFAKTLAKALSRPALLPAPAIALRTTLGEFAVELLASRRVLPKRALDAGYTFRQTDLLDALRAST